MTLLPDRSPAVDERLAVTGCLRNDGGRKHRLDVIHHVAVLIARRGYGSRDVSHLKAADRFSEVWRRPYWVNIGRPPVCTMSEVGSGSAVSEVSLLMTRSPLPTKRSVSPM